MWGAMHCGISVMETTNHHGTKEGITTGLSEKQWIAGEGQAGTTIWLDVYKTGNSYWNISGFFPTCFWSVYSEISKKSKTIRADGIGKVLPPWLTKIRLIWHFTNFSRLFFRSKLLLNTSFICLCLFPKR